MNVRNVAPWAIINSLILFPKGQSLFSPSLSEFYILLQSETRERERWERREEARGGDQENPSPSFIPSPLFS